MKKEIIFILASGLLMTAHASHNNNYHPDSFNWNLGSDLVETTIGAIPAAQATLINAKTAVSEAQAAYDVIDPTDTVALAVAQEALDVANTAVTTAQATVDTARNEKTTIFRDGKVSFDSIKAGLSGFFSELTTMDAGHDSTNGGHDNEMGSGHGSSSGGMGGGHDGGSDSGHGDSGGGSMGGGNGGGMGGGRR